MRSNYWQGRLVRLRAVEPEDWEAHHAWDQDSQTQRLLARAHFPRSREGTRRWAEQQATREPDGDNYHFEIESLAGELVGSIGVHHCDRRNGTFSIGIATRPEHQRKGYATEAVALALRYYFHELRYQKATVYVLADNEPSQRLCQRLGFQLEGRLRRMTYMGGRYHDEFVYGMTAEEFDASGLMGSFGSESSET